MRLEMSTHPPPFWWARSNPTGNMPVSSFLHQSKGTIAKITQLKGMIIVVVIVIIIFLPRNFHPRPTGNGNRHPIAFWACSRVARCSLFTDVVEAIATASLHRSSESRSLCDLDRGSTGRRRRRRRRDDVASDSLLAGAHMANSTPTAMLAVEHWVLLGVQTFAPS